MTQRTRPRVATSLAALALLAGPAAHADLVARGDAAWARRADGAQGGLARTGPVLEAVRHYEDAVDARADDLEARWKLLRALHFLGDFSQADEALASRASERARDVAEHGLDRLAQRAGAGARLESFDPASLPTRLDAAGVARHDAARLYFWSAIGWGAWSQRVGLLSAVRQGVANRLHDYTRVTIALEPGYDDGGALRLLGRLHAELPRVPFVSGWVDRDRALPLVERAYGLAPEHPGNRLLLALTLLDLAPDRRAEARELLSGVGELEPRPDMRVEDLTLRRQARERLRDV